tara:strand:+ start:1983 stop:2132 length:150 start_codon:yes stop_codon:yes gene_type:complete
MEKVKKMKKTKIEHRIPDKNGVSKQYPKVMKYPERHGFIWESSQTLFPK